MFAATVKQKVGKHLILNGDLTLSNYDKNRLSEIGNSDNVGLASFLSAEGEKALKSSVADTLKALFFASAENTDKSFKPLNQYRSAEFIRDWNYLRTVPVNEQILNFKGGLKTKESLTLIAGLQRFTAQDQFTGNRWNGQLFFHKHQFTFEANPSLTTTKDLLLSTVFARPNLRMSQVLPFLGNATLGFDLEAEQNKKNSLITDTLDKASYAFYYYKTYVSFGEQKDLGIRFSYNKRQDRFATKNTIAPALDINEIEVNTRWIVPVYSQLTAGVKLRDFKVINQVLAPGEKSKFTLLGNIDHNLSIFKSALTAATNYQVNSGQEPRLEFVFQKIENLRGEYVYVGSDTAKIKNINDFRYDPTNPLASYVKFFVPNNEFTTTNNISLNHNIRLDPHRYFVSDTGGGQWIKKLLSKTSAISAIRLTNKTISSDKTFSPVNFNTLDTGLVSYSKSIQTSVFFNRGNAAYDIVYTTRNLGTKNNQINGFEQRTNVENEVRTRISFLKNTDVIVLWLKGNKTFDNQLFTDRNFIISYTKYQGEISFRPSTKARFNLKYSFAKNQQEINNMENADKNELTFSSNLRQSQKSSMDASLSLFKIKYNGKSGSLIEYDLLEGLKNGQNYIWLVNYTRRISKLIDLIVTYEGRKTGTSPVIHTAKMQAKASF